MCYGLFPSGECCSSCRVVRSCKHATLQRKKTERERAALQPLKFNTVEKFSSNINKVLHDLLSRYPKGASTYRLGKDLKRYYNVNISDKKLLQLCGDLAKGGLAYFKKDGTARIWHAK